MERLQEKKILLTLSVLSVMTADVQSTRMLAFLLRIAIFKLRQALAQERLRVPGSLHAWRSELLKQGRAIPPRSLWWALPYGVLVWLFHS